MSGSNVVTGASDGGSDIGTLTRNFTNIQKKNMANYSNKTIIADIP